MLKNQLEAMLFSSGRRMEIGELSRLSHAKPDEIQNALSELKKEYGEKNSSVMLVNEGNFWKLTVREQFLPLVQKIVTETELSKTVTETLAVIAFKYPIKQSDLIKIRTNKAYDHLKELEEMGYISRQKHGRTNLIKLTQKFFEYFDLPEEKLKEQFRDFAGIAKAIEDKESEIESIKQQQKAQAEEEKRKDEGIKKEVDLLDDKGHKVALETYGNSGLKEEAEKEELGDLEVVSEPSEKELDEERERIQRIGEEGKKKLKEKTREKKKPNFLEAGIKLPPEMEKLVDEKVERILHPQEEEQEGNEEPEKEEESKDESEEEEPKDLLESEMEENKEEEKQ